MISEDDKADNICCDWHFKRLNHHQLTYFSYASRVGSGETVYI